ncbi:hypothetical protein [Streptomyces sp. NBC_00388]|uniref:hypothetical protein n=1 Tax=Streptomyces sp. NBC_00388 TaxID=2975735 RepID=UPI003FA6D015
MTPTTIRALRTVVQTAAGLAIALPALVDSGTLPRSLPWVGAALAVSGLLSRAMAVPAVQSLLPAWLTASDADVREPAAPVHEAPGAVLPPDLGLPSDSAETTTSAPAPAAHVAD